MKILKVSIAGFKNIEYVSLELSSITAIVGLNNFGKTNVLKGIEFASKFIRATESERHEYMKDECVIPINKKNEWENFFFSFVCEDNGTEFEYSFSFSWTNANKRGKIVSEELKVRNQASGRFIKNIYRNETEILYKASEDGRCQKPITMLSPTQFVTEYLLKRHSEIFYTNILEKINSFKVDYNRLSDSRIEQDKTNKEIAQDNLSLHIDEKSNILSVLKNIHTMYPEKYIMWENTVKSLVPTIEEFVFDVEKNNVPISGVHIPYSSTAQKYSMSVKEKNLTRLVDLFRLSSGIRRIFLLVLNIVLSPVNNFSIIEFEELESSINPLIIQRLLITISSICEDCKVIVTTHSPTLLNFINLDSIYIGVANDNDIAQFFRIKNSRRESLINNADEMGIGIGDIIFEMLLNDGDAGMMNINEWVDKNV